MSDRTPRKNWCYAIPLRGGRWGACQVLGQNKESGIDVIAFDLVLAKPPTLKQLEQAKPLVLTHHSHKGAEQRSWVSGPVPLEFEAIGERAPSMRTQSKLPSYAHWTSFECQIRLQHRWDHEIPKAEIKRYRAGDEAVTLGETTRVPGYSCTVGECAGATYPWPASQPVPWQAFDVAGTLTKLTYYGTDVGVLKYVAARKLVRELTWRDHGQSRIDFRGASLTTLRLDAARSLHISVDAELEGLTLCGHGKGRSVSVEHPSSGEGLELSLWEPKGLVMPPGVKGLERLTELDVTHLKDIDARALAKSYPALQRLTIRGKYARVVHAEALSKLKQLRSLTWYDVYELDVAALAKLPKLRAATFGGLRKSDAQLLRKQLAHLDDLEVWGAKNDAWIAANAENPLRDWVDDDERFGDKACKIFAKQYRAASSASDAAAAKKVLTDFVKAINLLDGKYELIDTIRREEAYEAYGQLADLMCVDKDQAGDWFSELCEF